MKPKAIELAKSFAGIKGMDLAKVCCDQTGFTWTQGSWQLVSPEVSPTCGHFKELGTDIEQNLTSWRMTLASKPTSCVCSLTAAVMSPFCLPKRLSARYSNITQTVFFLSNGPGDPEPCTYAIDAIKHIITETDIPLFGICLGHQLLALASGANLENEIWSPWCQPSLCKISSKVRWWITSQNHGFAVDETTLPSNVKVTHRSLFDGSNQGIELTNKPAFSFQDIQRQAQDPMTVRHCLINLQLWWQRRRLILKCINCTF